MLQSLTLLWPALIPSWRFFDEIAPSPRIEYRIFADEANPPDVWQAFRPRPAHVSLLTMLKRMFWNPRLNETLFLVSCAERLVQNPTSHSEDEIFKRIAADLLRDECGDQMLPYLQFRLVFVARNGQEHERHVAYLSTSRSYRGEG